MSYSQGMAPFPVAATMSPHGRTRSTQPSSLSPCRAGYAPQGSRNSQIMRPASRSPGPGGGGNFALSGRPVSAERSCSPSYGREAMQMMRSRAAAVSVASTAPATGPRGGSPMLLTRSGASPQPIAVASAPTALTAAPVPGTQGYGGIPYHQQPQQGARSCSPEGGRIAAAAQHGVRRGVAPAPIQMAPAQIGARGGPQLAQRCSSRDRREQEQAQYPSRQPFGGVVASTAPWGGRVRSTSPGQNAVFSTRGNPQVVTPAMPPTGRVSGQVPYQTSLPPAERQTMASPLTGSRQTGRWGRVEQSISGSPMMQPRTGSPLPSPHRGASPTPSLSPHRAISSPWGITAAAVAAAQPQPIPQSPCAVQRLTSLGSQLGSARGFTIRSSSSSQLLGAPEAKLMRGAQQALTQSSSSNGANAASSRERSTSANRSGQQLQQQQQQQQQQHQQRQAEDIDYAASSAEVVLADGEVSIDRYRLRPEQNVYIGEDDSQKVRFKVLQCIGHGSFGEVYAAEVLQPCDQSRYTRDRELRYPQMVIKEMIAFSWPDLMNGVFEGHLLKSFSRRYGQYDTKGDYVGGFEGLPDSCARRVPQLFTMQREQVHSEIWRTRLVMTRLLGEPLDNFTERERNDQDHWCRDSQRRNQPRDTKSLGQQLEKAVEFTRQLLLQLSPAMEHISKLALHRDANAHNILIETQDGQASFGLCDFGLAVDEYCWQLEDPDSPELNGDRPTRIGPDKSAKTWHHLDVGGDCRYWPVSAWVQFLHGCGELEKFPHLRFEYQVLLDLHSLGITAVELFVQLMPIATFSESEHGIWPQALYKLQCAWTGYWDTVTPLHRRLMDTFHNNGDWDALKRRCIEEQSREMIAGDLRNIRDALRHVGDLCTSEVLGNRLPAARELCETLIFMIQTGEPGPETLEELDSRTSQMPPKGPERWRHIQMLLSNGLSACDPMQFQGASAATVSTASTPGCTTASPRSQGIGNSGRSLEAETARPVAGGAARCVVATSSPQTSAPRPVLAHSANWATPSPFDGYANTYGHPGFLA